MYLRIANKGVADWRGLTLLGASTTSRRNTNENKLLGCFGSGSKFSLALLLRKRIYPVICCGNLKMEIGFKTVTVGSDEFEQVIVKFSGKDENGNTKNSTEELGFVTNMGARDWTKTKMAFREFLSNAIDGAILSGNKIEDVIVEVVDSPRAKAGYTSVFLPYCGEIEQCHKQMNTQFLHFKHRRMLENKFLPKPFLGPDEKPEMKVYKKGVLVYQNSRRQSIYDYNLGNEIELDESRNAKSGDVESAIALTIRNAPSHIIQNILQEVSKNPELVESTLSQYELKDNWLNEEEKKEIHKNWAEAWNKFAGEKGILTSSNMMADYVKNKGYEPIIMNSPVWFEVLKHYGVRTEQEVLSNLEQNHREAVETPENIRKSFDEIWEWLVSLKMTNGKNKPSLICWRSLRDAGSHKLGECDIDNGIIYIHVDAGGVELQKTILHEAIHWITGSLDCSLDYQDFCIRVAILMFEQRKKVQADEIFDSTDKTKWATEEAVLPEA